MLNKKAMDEITEAIWDRLAGDVAIGKGMLKSSVRDALAGWNEANGPVIPPMMTAVLEPPERFDDIRDACRKHNHRMARGWRI